jgi:hypothetical protein
VFKQDVMRSGGRTRDGSSALPSLPSVLVRFDSSVKVFLVLQDLG